MTEGRATGIPKIMKVMTAKGSPLPAIASGCLEMTLPNQPTSRLQRYRLTPFGRQTRREIESRR